MKRDSKEWRLRQDKIMGKNRKRLRRAKKIARRINKAQGHVPLWMTHWMEMTERYLDQGYFPWRLFDTPEEVCEQWRVDPKTGKEIPYVWETCSTILRKIGDHYLEKHLRQRVGFRKKSS